MLKRGRHRWSRSVAFLAIWVAFGGALLTGWLTQLQPQAQNVVTGEDDKFTSPLPTTVTTPSGETANQGGEGGTNGLAGSGGNGSPSTGNVPGAASPLVSGTNPTTGTSTTTAAPSKTTPALGTPPAPGKVKPINLTDCGTEKNASVAHPFGCNLASYVGNLYRWALVIGAGLAVMMIMYAGYTYVVSAGDPEAVRVAKDYLWGAIIGLVLLILTYTIYSVLRLGGGSTT